MTKEGRFDTLCIHAGQAPDPTNGALMTPVYFTSTYLQDGLGRDRGFDYARVRNPTRDAVEANLAALEGGAHGMAFGSGMAAVQAIFEQLSSGDHVVLGDNVYGGTFRLLDKVMTRFGLTYTQVDTADLAGFKATLRPNTKLVMLETPTNPMLGITDIPGVRRVMAQMGCKAVLAVDNTFATPFNQRPLDLGADLVVAADTKAPAGHSDALFGHVALEREHGVVAAAPAGPVYLFQDEFNGLTLDPAKWVDHYDWWSPPQTFSTTNIDVANGTLRAQPDVVILGMGADGHTASFFPGGDTLSEAIDPHTDKPMIAISAPGSGEPRLTFTLPALLAASSICLHIEGHEKMTVLRAAMAGSDPLEMPIRAVLAAAKPLDLYWCP